jgi:hypothetical protein
MKLYTDEEVIFGELPDSIGKRKISTAPYAATCTLYHFFSSGNKLKNFASPEYCTIALHLQSASYRPCYIPRPLS